MSAHYWIAQYVQDVFRNEPRNVGVFVAVGNDIAAKFFGENEDFAIDGRTLRKFPHPEAYRQWIKYWRGELTGGRIASLPESSSANFRVLEAGKVVDIGADCARDVATYLYSTLVSDGGIGEALALVGEEEEQLVQLDTEVEGALAQAQLMEIANLAPHPIRKNAPVVGRLVPEYKPAFSQRNGLLYVMETVDFTKSKKRISRDHAGWSACMYRDVREVDSTAKAISIIRVTDEDLEVDDVRSGLALLKSEGPVVNWLDQIQRTDFLEERREIAFHLGSRPAS
jgi:hypothetical protein